MKRREFITLLGGAAAWPLAARAQQLQTPVVGFLRSAPLTDVAHFVSAFRGGLIEMGFIEGQNVAIEFRSAENDLDRLPALVGDLLRHRVAVIAANGVAAVAAKAATKTVPIVFATGSDPIADGLVASFNRPGGNVTGVSFLGGVVAAKRVAFLRELVPKATIIGLLLQPDTAESEAERREVRIATQTQGQRVVIIDVVHAREIESAFVTFVERGASALLIGAGGFLNANRGRIIALAARYKLPACHAERTAAFDGGLMSYGASGTDAYRQVGVYAGRILKGESPADLPVMQSVKLELILNLKTARTLGLEIPPKILALTDDVIE
jgi:putative ABC transport system substrate-binding protein